MQMKIPNVVDAHSGSEQDERKGGEKQGGSRDQKMKQEEEKGMAAAGIRILRKQEAKGDQRQLVYQRLRETTAQQHVTLPFLHVTPPTHWCWNKSRSRLSPTLVRTLSLLTSRT